MKLTTLATSIALAIGAVTSAQAAIANRPTLASYLATPGNFAEVNISGASAQDNMIESVMGELCETDTLVAYRGISGSNQRFMMCKVDPAKLTISKSFLLVRKNGLASGQGVVPVAAQTAVSFADLATIACPALPVSTNVTGVAPLQNYTRVTCTTTPLVNLVPDVGVSDVEPAIFGATTAQLNAMTISATNDLVFAIAVTKNLRDALQTAQGLASNNEDPANMPTLSTEQVSGLLTGNINDWSQLVDKNGNALANGAFSTTVKLCKRPTAGPTTSGTQKITEITFLNNPCAGDAGLDMTATDNVDTFENTSTGNLITCLKNRFTANEFGIGFMSTENVPGLVSGSTDNAHFRFVKVDGVAPNLLGAANAKYRYWATNTLQYNTARLNLPANANQKAVAIKLVNTLQNPALVSAVNVAFKNAVGPVDSWDGGYLVPNLNSFGASPTAPSAAPAGQLTALEVRANPVNATSKQTLSAVKNCQAPVPAQVETDL